jgi:hypothetical protein
MPGWITAPCDIDCGVPIRPAGVAVMVALSTPHDTGSCHSYSKAFGPEKELIMALFMDVHTLGGAVGIQDVAQAHQADLQTQGKHDVNYLRYWVDEKNGKIFCLVDAPSADAAATVHRDAHGLVADEIYSVAEGE